MEGDTNGVRIIPRVVEFRDTDVNETYTINITVKNISKASKEIRYYPPQTKVNLTAAAFKISGAVQNVSIYTYVRVTKLLFQHYCQLFFFSGYSDKMALHVTLKAAWLFCICVLSNTIILI